MENNSSNRFNLENYKKKDLFTVPDQYFKELPSRIQSRIDQSKSRRWYEDLTFNPLLKNLSIAFGVILITFGIYMFNKPSEQIPTSAASIAKLTNEEVVEYLVNNPSAAMQVEEYYEGEVTEAYYSEDEIVEHSDADEIEEIVIDL
jgi:hypothetical protein